MRLRDEGYEYLTKPVIEAAKYLAETQQSGDEVGVRCIAVQADQGQTIVCEAYRYRSFREDTI